MTPPAGASPEAEPIWRVLGWWLEQIAERIGSPLAQRRGTSAREDLKRLVAGLESLSRLLAADAALAEGERLIAPAAAPTAPDAPSPEPSPARADPKSAAAQALLSEPSPAPRSSVGRLTVGRPFARAHRPRTASPESFTRRFSPVPHLRIAGAGFGSGGAFPKIIPRVTPANPEPRLAHLCRNLAGRLEAVGRFARNSSLAVQRLAHHYACATLAVRALARWRRVAHACPPVRPITEWMPRHDALDAWRCLNAAFLARRRQGEQSD